MILCALPPLDMRYSRVVAQNAHGIDLMAFGADRRPAGATVVAPVAGVVRLRTGYVRYGYRNAVVIEAAGADRPTFVCLSGLAFAGRAEDGSYVRSGMPVGQIEVPSRIDFLRSRDRTAGADADLPYLHVESWTQDPPRFESHRTLRGEEWRLEGGVISPAEFWSSVGIDFSGRYGSQTMLIRQGGPAASGCT